MTDRPIPVRLEDSLIERLDAVVGVLSHRAAGAPIHRSAVLRMAVERGLESLESEVGIATKPKKKPKR